MKLYKITNRNTKLSTCDVCLVIAHNIKPKWLVGFCLKVTSSKFLSFKQGEYIYINYVYKDTAKYTVNKSGLKGGYLIDFEKVEDNCILMTNG